MLKVSKPLRYCGGEVGMISKPHAERLKFCLTFPDIYEIGMSHLGFKILYSALNQNDNIVCERFFAPYPDALEILDKDIMVTLESHTHIKNFDVLGFSFLYEMSYPTALQLLAKADISLLSAERGENEPIIVAGGCCILNPAPLSEFIDVFFVGEMDKSLNIAMEKLHTLKKSGANRKKQLEMLNEFPFTYVPSIQPEKTVTRQIFTEFSDELPKIAPIVPLMPVTQDRVTAEIARGCTNGCRFCQAGMIYRPVRERSVAMLCESSLNMINETGYQTLSLLSLDAGDYSQIKPLLDTLGGALNQRKVALSMPSLRAETVNPDMFKKIGVVRKSGFTIAPEAGSQRLRDVINKNLTEEDIINAAVYAKNAGYNGAKLYFMCGLPYETDDDILAIGELVRKIRTATRGGRFFDITVSVSNFVPKPHTPFERFGQLPAEELRRRHFILKDELKYDKVKLKFHDANISAVEAAFARGDNRWTKILKLAAERGFYLDAWGEFFSRERWQLLFDDSGFSIADFAEKSYTDDEKLVWGMVDCGLNKNWMIKERDKAAVAETTLDCRRANCSACGICDFKTVKNVSAAQSMSGEHALSRHVEKFSRYELIFSKNESAIFMSALDLVRIFTHILLVSGVQPKFTEGFSPLPRTILQAPIPVGVAGNAESLLLEADSNSINQQTIEKINAIAPKGLKILSIQEAVWPKNLSSYTMTYQFDEKSFLFLFDSLNQDGAYYEKTDKQGRSKVVRLSDYLQGVCAAENSVDVIVTDKGGFHFPEFFRKAGYSEIPHITRKNLKPL